jgi:hypothetical protein
MGIREEVEALSDGNVKESSSFFLSYLNLYPVISSAAHAFLIKVDLVYEIEAFQF